VQYFDSALFTVQPCNGGPLCNGPFVSPSVRLCVPCQISKAVQDRALVLLVSMEHYVEVRVA